MADRLELARAFVTIVPSMQGAQAAIRSGLDEAAGQAGEQAGQTFGNSMTSSLESTLGRVGQGFTTIGTTLSACITAPIVAAATGSVAAASNFEDAFAMLRTIADPDEISMEELNDQIMELSRTSGIGAAAIAEASYSAISAGQNTADAVGFVAQASQLARGGFTDLSTATDVLTTALNAYGLSSDEATHVSDVLIQTQNLGKTTVDQLAASMGRVIPTASAANVAIEDLASQYVALTKNGIATAEATTYINSMLNELSRSGTNASNTFLEAAGVTFPEYIAQGHSTAEAMDLLAEHCSEAGLSVADAFGSAEAGRAATVLVQHTEDATGAMVAMQTTSGQTAEAFAIMSETSSVRLQELKNSVVNLGISLGESILPIVVPIAEQVIEFLGAIKERWDALSPATQEMIIKIAGIAAVIGPVLLIIGKISSTAGSLIGAVRNIGGGISSLAGHFSNFAGSATQAASGAASAGSSFASMAGTALMLVALGAAIFLIAEGMSVMAQAAISLAEAGPAAIAVFFGMVGAATAMAVVILLVGSAATVGAVGLLALGAAVLMVSAGVALIVLAMSTFVGQLPMIAQFAAPAAAGLALLNIQMLAALGASMAMTVGLLALSAAALVAFVPFIAAAASIALTDVALAAMIVTASLAAAGMLILSAGLRGVDTQMRDIADNADRTADSLSDMVDAVDVVQSGLQGLATIAGNVVQAFVGAITGQQSSARSAGQQLAESVKTGVNTGIRPLSNDMNRELRSVLSSVNGMTGQFQSAGQQMGQAFVAPVLQSIAYLQAAFASTSFRFNTYIPLPHFSMSGSFNAQTGRVPTVGVQWYRRAAEEGALFTRPTIVGVGDARQPELLLGEDKLRELVGGKPVVVNMTVNGAPGQSETAIANMVMQKIQQAVNRKGAVFG